MKEASHTTFQIVNVWENSFSVCDPTVPNPDVQIIRLKGKFASLVETTAVLPKPSAFRWVISEINMIDSDADPIELAEASMFVSCLAQEIEIVTEVMIAIAARPQSILVGIDLKDLAYRIGFSTAHPAVGVAFVYDGLASDVPDTFLYRRGFRKALLMQLVSSEHENGILEELMVAALNTKEAQVVSLSAKDNASTTALVLICFT